MIRNRFKLSFPFGAPNNRLNQDMILLSYHVFLSCAPNDPLVFLFSVDLVYTIVSFLFFLKRKKFVLKNN